MILSILFSETSLKRKRFGGKHVGSVTVQEDTKHMSQMILNFFSLNKEAN